MCAKVGRVRLLPEALGWGRGLFCLSFFICRLRPGSASFFCLCPVAAAGGLFLRGASSDDVHGVYRVNYRLLVFSCGSAIKHSGFFIVFNYDIVAQKDHLFDPLYGIAFVGSGISDNISRLGRL